MQNLAASVVEPPDAKNVKPTRPASRDKSAAVPASVGAVSRVRAAPAVAAVATVWFLIVLLLWAVRPLSGMVQVGIDYTVEPPRAVSVRVHCNSLFADEPGTGGSLPEFPPQPEGRAALAVPVEPCAYIHADARRAFGVDTIVLILVLGGVAAYLAWSKRATLALSVASCDVPSAPTVRPGSQC